MHWREVSRKLYDYLRRDMRDASLERMRLYPVNGSTHVMRTVPFVWAIARELATSYVQDPSRRFVGLDGTPLPESTARMIADVYKASHVNRIMRQSQRQLVALNNATVWVWPQWESGGVALSLIPVHEQEVEMVGPFGWDEHQVAAWRFRVPVPLAGSTGLSTSIVAHVTPTLAVWEGGTDAGRGVYRTDGANPFGQVPVVMIRGTDPAPGEWWAAVNEDMLQAQNALNHDLTDVGHIARIQGYGQPVAKGMSGGAAKEIQLGPETAIGIPDAEGSFEFASANPSLSGYVEQLKEYVQQVVGMNGMNPATFMKSAGITALAKQIELIDRESYRKEHNAIMRRSEQRLYDVMRLAINLQRGADVWPEATVEVEYREPIIPADPLHDAQALKMLIEMGQTSEARARATRDGISLDEARIRVAEDKAESAAYMVRPALPPVAAEVAVEVPHAEDPEDPVEMPP